jgi:hypothetical protein
MHDPLIVAAANHASVLVEDSRGNLVQAWLLHATPSRVRVCFTNGTSGTIPRTHVRLTSTVTATGGDRMGEARAASTAGPRDREPIGAPDER